MAACDRKQEITGSISMAASELPIAPDNAAIGSGKSPDAVVLLERIRNGDREAAAEFVLHHRAAIQRRFRQRMGLRVRRLLDSLDLVSTIARRLDAVVRIGNVRSLDDAQLWALVVQIGSNALTEMGRVQARLDRVEGPDSEIARVLRCRLARAQRREPEGAMIEVDRILRVIPHDIDRHILTLWLSGYEHAEIAEEIGIAPATVRQRWSRLCTMLRSGYEARDFA